MSNISVGQRIRKLRKERGLTLVEVAGQEFTKGYISQVELGRVEPSFKLLSHIADKLDLKVEQLLSSENNLDCKHAIMENDLLCEKYEKVIESGKDIKEINRNPTIAKIKLMQLKAFYHLDRYQDSIELAKEILKLSEDWSRSYRLEAYSFMGISMFAQNSFAEVVKLYDAAFDFADKNELNQSKLLANMYLNRATAFQNLGEYRKAVIYYNETLEFASEHDCKETVLDAFLRMGFCHYKLGELDLAKKYIFDGFKINRILDIKLPQAESLLILSYILVEESNYKATEIVLSKALSLFGEVNRVQGVVESLFVLAKVYMETNQNEIVIDKLVECVGFIKSARTIMFEHSLLKSIAKSCMNYGLHEEASTLFSMLVES